MKFDCTGKLHSLENAGHRKAGDLAKVISKVCIDSFPTPHTRLLTAVASGCPLSPGLCNTRVVL